MEEFEQIAAYALVIWGLRGVRHYQDYYDRFLLADFVNTWPLTYSWRHLNSTLRFCS